MKTMTFSEFFNKKHVIVGLTEQEIHIGETFKYLLYILVAIGFVAFLPTMLHIPTGIENAFLQW